MKRSLTLSLCTVALVAMAFRTVEASEVVVTLDLSLDTNNVASNGGTWSLWGRIDDPGTGVDGSIGLAAINAIINGIDFGTGGNAVSISSTIGAINPVATANGDRLPVLDVGNGTVDILYGQDITTSSTLAVGVNNGPGLVDRLIASGTYSGAAPTFASTTGTTPHSTDANLLTSATSAAAPDSVSTLVVTLGDVSGDGIVTSADIQLFVNELLLPGGSTNFASDVDQSGLVTSADIQIFASAVIGTKIPNPIATASATAVGVPEPSSLGLLVVACLGMVRYRKNRE